MEQRIPDETLVSTIVRALIVEGVVDDDKSEFAIDVDVKAVVRDTGFVDALREAHELGMMLPSRLKT